MATLALAAAGSYLGGIVGANLGYAAIGSSIGFAAGSLLGQSFQSLPDQQGPRLEDLTISASTYGAPINTLYGTARSNGSIIWAADLIEYTHTEKVGGKGGPSQSVTTYSYYADFAFQICEGEIEGVSKIWADSVLIYDAGSDAGVGAIIASDEIAKGITVYTGTETQEPDPLIESYKGTNNVPAHRGMAYVVFNELALANFGNRIPNITVETISTGSTESEWSNIGDLGVYGNDIVALENGTLIAATGQFISAGAGGTATGAIYISSDYGATWSLQATLSATRRANYFAVDEKNKNKIFVGTDDGKIHVSYDYGITWTTVATLGGNNNPPRTIIVLDESVLLVGMFSGQLYRSTDNGASFTNVAPVASTWYDFVKIDDTNVLADNTNGPIYRSNDAGLTWASVVNLGSNDARAGIHIGGGIVFVGCIDGRIFKSLDFGYSWDQITSPTSGNINSFYYYNGTVTFSTGSTWYYSTDEGDNWTADSLNTNPDGNKGVRAISGDLLMTVDDSSIGEVYIKKGALITSNTVTLSSIVSDLCTKAGLTAGEIDVSALTDNVAGYIKTRQSTARAAIEPLRQAYFFDLVEIDAKLVAIKRGGNSVYTITDDSLAAYTGDNRPDALTIARKQDVELYKRISVNYMNSADDYQPNTQYAARLVTSAVNEINVTLPVVLTDDEAAQIVEILLFDSWVERDQVNFTLSLFYIDLTPGNIVTITNDTISYRVRITRIDNDGAILNCTGVIDMQYYTSTVAGGASSGLASQVAGLPGVTLLNLLDVNMLRDQDNSAGFYVSGSGVNANWSAAVLYGSSDNQSFDNLSTIRSSATFGTTTEALAAGTKNRIDRTNTINVSLLNHNGSLSSITEVQLVGTEQNAAIIGNEIIQFQTATLESDGTYTLSNLLRCRRGSEEDTHSIGERFILLDTSTLVRIDQNNTDLDVLKYYKGVTVGNFLEETDTKEFTNTGNCLKPYAPVSVKGSRDGSNNLTITWLRRSRLTARALWSPTLNEDSESYEVDIIGAGSPEVLRTITATSETASYTAAQQTTDGLTPGDPVTVRVYQISAVVDRGYTREEII